jgi:uncharacterized membrane protein YecN with MAPEG domain
MLVLPFYAALLALLFVGLSIKTIRTRRALKIAVGDGGNNKMIRAMRAHANFAEYVPFSLVLIYLVELQAQAPVLIHILGMMLVVGRIAHAYGITQENENFRFRVFGMAITLTAIITSSVCLLILFAQHFFST